MDRLHLISVFVAVVDTGINGTHEFRQCFPVPEAVPPCKSQPCIIDPECCRANLLF